MTSNNGKEIEVKKQHKQTAEQSQDNTQNMEKYFQISQSQDISLSNQFEMQQQDQIDKKIEEPKQSLDASADSADASADNSQAIAQAQAQDNVDNISADAST